ncbi:hypothetical protein CULCOIPH002_19210 [Corynebacterium ulcerans]|uniref:Uncharacterized protein n=1 Tax=Corynebacterium ulcerans TaxID=65058 RepID=A0ABD0BFZ9_CORUL|nr:Hypothetical protein Cul210932_1658 [Corynebacterium ulcerans]GJJ33936.1 hypothetical protein CULCOIPH001_11440 [Corynebacterium ulcerans]GJJ37009.1 hypothetical protein CULCOIPH002_19210 [Corynebacterium ulcerans]GJJ37567.1 hypothetical protein CULCOIPH003_01980 [Corynebacterium ulcerans]GJJ40659.1 hypothetical protein CULCOIPH004_10700 [Corynebacterium ulcerans]
MIDNVDLGVGPHWHTELLYIKTIDGAVILGASFTLVVLQRLGGYPCGIPQEHDKLCIIDIATEIVASL